jgi:hypothetical protein
MKDSAEAQIYRIQIRGRLRPEWSGWFDGLTLEVVSMGDGDTHTTLTGPVPDQTALHGILMRIRDLGLTLEGLQMVGKGDPR